MMEDQIDDAVCEIMQEHGPDGHVDGHEVLTAFVMKCIAAERERCKRIVQMNQYRNGHHTHDGTTMGHYDLRMFDEIDSGLPPKA